ncbi:MAG: DEAD/DEAH box helicase family protein [Nitrospira sp.]
MAFNIGDFAIPPKNTVRYHKRLEKLKASGRYTVSIEKAVEGAIANISEERSRSFVIYGEPQSGKTEMMIALTARLLDEGHRLIVVLLNDSVQLLNQNLERFRRSGLDPAPKNFNEILDPTIEIGESEWVIFSKKNSKDLKKLINKLHSQDGKIIIDDEADYATPNSKINHGERTKINELVGNLIGNEGIYIGVTATPARLDLNNTFENDNERWIDFPPHPDYKGQNTFFPVSLKEPLGYRLNLLPDTGDDPKHLREALFGFFVNVAYLNLRINPEETNYCMLIHTSGKKADHTGDYKQVVKAFASLKNVDDDKFESYLRRIWEIAKDRYPGEEDTLTKYIRQNINRNTIVVMNSDIDKKVVDYMSATVPSTLFTVAIGGNIVSRGVTFEHLLSMFFTRDVKHRIQQDTYIQRARMFGSRESYLHYFELSIPERLYLDWHKCFVFHTLALGSIRSGNGSPVWLEDSRIAAVASSSINRSTVTMDSGEMSFELFDYHNSIEELVSSDLPSLQKLERIAQKLGNSRLPEFLLTYIRNFSPDADQSLAIHESRSIAGYKDAGTDQDKVRRTKGFIGQSDLEEKKYPLAIHHVKIFYNQAQKARVFYKYKGNIKFLKNLKVVSHA